MLGFSPKYTSSYLHSNLFTPHIHLSVVPAWIELYVSEEIDTPSVRRHFSVIKKPSSLKFKKVSCNYHSTKSVRALFYRQQPKKVLLLVRVSPPGALVSQETASYSSSYSLIDLNLPHCTGCPNTVLCKENKFWPLLSILELSTIIFNLNPLK